MSDLLLSWIVDLASWALILSGSALVVIGAIGLVRMPDLFTRMHAAGITDSCGSTLLLLGLALQAGPGLAALKLLILVALLFFCSPVSTHALARAALHAGIRPFLVADRRDSRRVEQPYSHAAE